MSTSFKQAGCRMPSDQISHAKELSNLECLVIEVAFKLFLNNLEDNAQAVLFAGLFFVRYTQALPPDKTQRSAEQDSIQSSLALALQDALDLAEHQVLLKAKLPRVSDVLD